MLGAVAAGLCPGAALAGPETDYKALFGDAEARVLATRTTEDDGAFAVKLLDAAKTVSDQKDLQRFLYAKTAEFGIKDAAGLAAAETATRALLKLDRANRSRWTDHLVTVLSRRFADAELTARAAAGDALIDALLAAADMETAAGEIEQVELLYRRALRTAETIRSPRHPAIERRQELDLARVRARKRLGELTEKLGKDNRPADREALILLHLLDMNDPAAAAKLVDPSISEAFRTYVPLAARPVKELPAPLARELGFWYATLAGEASAAGRVNALRRAEGCFQRFLDKHGKGDAEALRVRLALEKTRKQLTDAAGEPASEGKELTLPLGKDAEMAFIRIEPGTFQMGTPGDEKGRQPDENLREVTLSRPYYMGKTPVTFAQFKAFVDATGYRTHAERKGWANAYKGRWRKFRYASWKRPGFMQGKDHPVVCVSFGDAEEFCQWLSKVSRRTVRLPTEAEWECACRAGTRTRFHFGNDERQLGDYAWYRENSRGRTHSVASKKPNARGLYDMHGHVWEWCSDWWSTSYVPLGPVTDPTGPTTGTRRVLRGGCWFDVPQWCRSGDRAREEPPHRSSNIGFRVVVEARED